MSKTPEFSIIVPTYNQANYLKIALDSILAQTFPDWEAVVVNDGSTDNTREVLDAYAAKDARFRVIHQKNGGTAAALNTALQNATGRWVCWLSSDDLFEPEKLDLHRQWIEKYPETKFHFTYFRFLYESTGKMDREHGLWGPLPDQEFQVIGFLYRNYISGISVCINREAWASVGEFDPSMGYAQDYDMWLKLLAKFPARFIPEWTCISRNHDLQGMMTFPQRGLYDTAKSAITFLNRHKFSELFPMLDLSQPDNARRALEQSLDVAGKPDAFLYALGVHPALILRVMEWISELRQSGDPRLAQELETAFRQRAESLGQQYDAEPFGYLWQAAAQQDLSAPLIYQEISPVETARLHYWLIDGCRHLVPDWYWYQKEPFRRYLEKHLETPVDIQPVDIKGLVAQQYPYPTSVKVRLMRADRKQVVFVERALVGGGAERVIHSIAHHLDREDFDVRIVYLFEQEGAMPPYLLPVYSLEPPKSPPPAALPLTRKQRVKTRLSSLYKRVVPQSIRRRVRPIVRYLLRLPPDDVQVIEAAPPPNLYEFLPPLVSRYWYMAVRLDEVLSKFEKDPILISVMEEASVVVWMSQVIKKRPYINSLHTVESIYFPRLYPEQKQHVVEKHLFVSSNQNALKVTLPSQGCAFDLREHFCIPDHLLAAVPNPVNIDQIRALASEPLPFGLPKGKAVFVHVGRLDVDKNHELLVKACALLKEKTEDFVLICLGKGPYQDEIQQVINQLGLQQHVFLYGEVLNPYPFMAAARSLVLTSKFESFALVLVEAMACGAVPVSVDCPYGPGEILGDQEYGLVVPMDDPQAFADAMLRIATDDTLYHALRAKGSLRCRDFDTGSIIPQWEKLLQDCACPPAVRTALE